MGHYPPYKIIGSNDLIKKFLNECAANDIPVSSANSFFRDDYEHCVIPAYSFSENNLQNGNIKLQLLSSDFKNPDIVYDLATDYDKALSFVELIAEINSN